MFMLKTEKSLKYCAFRTWKRKLSKVFNLLNKMKYKGNFILQAARGTSGKEMKISQIISNF